MAKLSKAEAKLHQQACDLLAKDVLSFDDKCFVFENWQESANHVNSTAGAFFTPLSLARDFSLEMHGYSIIDICAGIGSLSFYAIDRVWSRQEKQAEITCVEINPAYMEIGKKIMPEARWICADIFDLPQGLGTFDTAISNPPFGATPRRGGKAPRYTGGKFEYAVIDIASNLAKWGAFIIRQQSSGFRYSAAQYFQRTTNDAYQQFYDQTKIELDIGVGIDTSVHRDQWHGVSPLCEIACADFEEARARRAKPAPARPATEPTPYAGHMNLFD